MWAVGMVPVSPAVGGEVAHQKGVFTARGVGRIFEKSWQKPSLRGRYPVVLSSPISMSLYRELLVRRNKALGQL